MQNNLKVEFEPITDEMVNQILKNHDQVLTVVRAALAFLSCEKPDLKAVDIDSMRMLCLKFGQALTHFEVIVDCLDTASQRIDALLFEQDSQ